MYTWRRWFGERPRDALDADYNKDGDHQKSSASLFEHFFKKKQKYSRFLKLGTKYIHYLFAKLFYKVRSDSEQHLSEDIMVLSENAVCEKMEATTPNLQDSEKEKSHPSFRVAQENRHQEIWSVLEGVWNTMNLYRYSM